MNSTTLSTDFLVIGSGAAGLNAALHASTYGQVTLVTKSDLEDSSSYWAQGGIAAVLNGNDTFQSHKNDTLDAGRALCNTEAVDLLVKEGAREVQRCIDLGMTFDSTNGTLDLGLEGGHSNRRVLHANGAATGKALIEFLTSLVQKEPNISITERAFVYELFRNENSCQGAAAYLYDDNRTINIQSPVTILATGGYSGLFQRSTNPHTSTGDGLWLGYDLGTTLQDLELVQFHPTAFYADDGSTFLISEAVRGEGAYLFNEDGKRFMEDYPQQELAPRDVVSQEIFRQIQQQKGNCVFLDVRHLDTNKLRAHFPNLIAKIEEQGIAIEQEGIPVAPAAHYCIGGVATDLNAQTSINGLYACGEVAATGVHGANRLASNSLLECLVFSKRAIDHARRYSGAVGVFSASDFSIRESAAQAFTELQQKVSGLLSQYVGIQRSRQGLTFAIEQLQKYSSQLNPEKGEYFSIRSQGLLQLAELIARAALERTESRGVHTRTDFPESKSDSRHITFNQSLQHTESI